MKYILICLAAAALCFLGGYLIACRIQKARNSLSGRVQTVFFTVGCGIILLTILSLTYFCSYYHAGDKALEAMKGNDAVEVKNVNGGYIFDGPSADKAIVFYPGAKIEVEAYAPLALKFAEAGIDCFLADVPFNFSLFGVGWAEKFMEAYAYDQWFIAGHSMGGTAAANFAAKYTDRLDGIILLASYPSVRIEDGIRLCSVFGSEDGCLDIGQYEKSRENFPQDFLENVIDGGNHSQFGDYGIQAGDGMAFISGDEQRRLTVETVLEWISDRDLFV